VVDPPPLPQRLTRPADVVAAGTAAWLVATVVLFVAWLAGERPLDIWFGTCVVGVALGGVGYAVFRWQRAAARRGSRTAQRGLE